MSTPNLPPLVSDSSLATPPAPGEWVSQNVSLDKLADSLDLPRTGGSAADLRSIPDVWAQVLAFHQALVFNRADQPQPLYAEARAQWRSLLALFALRAAYAKAYLIRLEPLDLGEGAARGGAGALFRRVLGFLLPRERLPQAGVGDSGEARWDRPVMLYVRERTGGADDAPVFAAPWQAAGLLNPSTLVAPGRTAASLRIAAAPWLRDGLADPTALPPDRRLGRRDYALLVDWLQRLQRALAEVAGERANEATYNALSAELAAYAADCARLAEGFDRPIRLDDGPLPRADLARLYRELQRAPVVAAEAYPEGHSDCALELRSEFGAPVPGAEDAGARAVFNGLILFDRDLARTLNRAPQDVHVWREHTLQSLLDAPGLLAQVRREAADAGWLIVEAADYFTPEFARLAPGVVVDGHDEPFRGAVLPLSPLALWSLRPREIGPALRLSSTGEGDYAVSLNLPLAAARQTHAVGRTYRTGAEGEAPNAAERVNAQFGAISTWPDFAQRGWRWNFLRLSYNPGMTGLQGRFGVSAQHMAEALAAEPDAGRRDLRARTWFDSSGLRLEEQEFRRPVTPPASAGAPAAFERLRFRDSEVLVEELQISAAPPEAVCVARKRTAADRAARPVGLILLRQEPSRALQPESAVVAVDFGTTNTVASLKGEPVRFKNRVRMAIRQPANEEENRRDFKWSFVDFFPLADHASPIPTVAKRREIDAGNDPALRAVAEARDERPLFSDMIFFQPALGDPLNHQTRQDVGELKRRQGSLRFKLKWSGEPLTKDISRRFLREFMLLTAAELVDRDLDPVRARWRFSFPEAMGAENERGLRRDLVRAWNDLFPDRAAPESDDHRVRPLTPESAAAAKYFLNYVEGGAASGVVNVVLDIGGGTTDIAIVRKSEPPLWRGSFRLAGGDFLTHYLMNNAEYFRHLQLDDLAELRASFSSEWSTLYPPSEAEDNNLKDFGELLFSDARFARAMADRYDVVKDTAEGRGLRHSAFVFMGGLAWYVGLVARRLVAEARIRPEELGAVSFGMGGRGATLFRHHQAASAGRSSPLNDLLGLFLAAAGVDPATHPHRAVLFSRQAKMEVVLGMAGEGATDLDELQLLSQAPASRWTPLGEAVSVETADGPAVLPADGDAAALAGVTRAGVPGELAEFKRFLRELRELTGVQINLREGERDGADAFLRTKLHAHLAAVAAAVRALKPGDRPPVFEPPFIVLLRALLDRLGLPAAERRARVAAEDV